MMKDMEQYLKLQEQELSKTRADSEKVFSENSDLKAEIASKSTEISQIKKELAFLIAEKQKLEMRVAE